MSCSSPRRHRDERRGGDSRSWTSSGSLTCATLGRDGWPHLMPLWYVVRDGECWAWTYAKSQKVRNLERDSRCTLQIEAGESLHRAARRDDQVRGRDPSRARRGRAAWAPSWPRATAAAGRARRRAPGGEAGRAAVRRVAPTWVSTRCDHRKLERRHASLPPHGAAQGPDPLGRQGHAPAPDHLHVGEAARAGREQAGAVLRDRGDGRGGDPRGRDHHRARDRRRDPRGRRRRRAFGVQITYIEQDAPLGLGARGADRRAVPGRPTRS